MKHVPIVGHGHNHRDNYMSIFVSQVVVVTFVAIPSLCLDLTKGVKMLSRRKRS